MTQEEKVEALVDELGIIYTDTNRATIKELLMEMAKWKDEQFTKEKQALINEACEWLKNNIDDYMMTSEGEFQEWFDDMYEDLKVAMYDTGR